jgi:hypothetical protein
MPFLTPFKTPEIKKEPLIFFISEVFFGSIKNLQLEKLDKSAISES